MPFILLFLITFTTSLYAFNWKYEKCSQANNYLESQINNFKNVNCELFQGCPYTPDRPLENSAPLKKIAASTDPFSQCIYASMQAVDPDANSKLTAIQVKNKMHFMKCSSHRDEDPIYMTSANAKKIPTPLQRPCLSENYHHLLYKSFMLTSDCLNYSAEEKESFFMVLNHESHFMVNIGNAQGTSGVSQLTSSGIAEVNRIYSKDPRKMDGKKIASFADDNIACNIMKKTLSEPITLDKKNEKNKCDRVAVPRNPLRSLVYGSLLFRITQTEAVKIVKEVFPNLKEGEEAYNQLVRMVAMTSYNTGVGTIKSVLRALNKKEQAKLMAALLLPQVEDCRGDIDQVKQDTQCKIDPAVILASFIRTKSTTAPARKKEMSDYLLKVYSDASKTEKIISKNYKGNAKCLY